MDFENCTEEVQQIIENTFDIVCRCKSRYIMPEDMLYAMTFNRNFIECFEKNGGSSHSNGHGKRRRLCKM